MKILVTILVTAILVTGCAWRDVVKTGFITIGIIDILTPDEVNEDE